MACGGDKTELCGDGNRMNVYLNTGFGSPSSTTSRQPTSTTKIATTTSVSSPSSTPTVVASSGTFNYLGCYFDQESPRVLISQANGDATVAMTVEDCTQTARLGGWQYAGVEFGYQCFVGNQLHQNSMSNPTDCNQACSGNSAEVCGAGNRISVYKDSAWFDPTAAMLVTSLQAYQTELNGALADINTYLSDVKALKATRGSKKRWLMRPRDDGGEQIELQNLVKDGDGLRRRVTTLSE